MFKLLRAWQRLWCLQVKDYVEQQWVKILSGRVSLADFVFAKEVRLGTYSGKGPAPPAAIVAAKAMAQDPRAEPRFSERVPYVVVHGAPGLHLTFHKCSERSTFSIARNSGLQLM